MTERRAPGIPRIPRIPAHLAVLVGVSTGIYAITLAGVTSVQSDRDTRLAIERAPFGIAADAAASDHDRLEAELEAAIRRYDAMADRYRAATTTMADTEAGLDALAERAGALVESAADLPTRFSLPTVRSVPRVVAAPPATDATTRASG